MRKDLCLIFPAQQGATLVEYILATALLGLIVVGLAAFFEPSANKFHQEMADGVYAPYPTNFIEPSSSPSPAPSP